MADRVPTLERYREYLALLARIQLRDERNRIDASDIVQDAMLDAHRQWPNFRGTSDPEVRAWLRRILAGRLNDNLRKLTRGKRDVRRSRSLQEELDRSSARLEDMLAGDQSTPSMHASQTEDLERLAEVLTLLPDKQREALLLRHCEGWTLEHISEHLGCNVSSVAGLIARGSKRIRDLLRTEPDA